MKLIPLTQGQFAKVDDEDYEELMQYNWFAMKNPWTYYASRQTGHGKGNQKLQAMHRFLLGLKDPKMEAHHKDHDGLNNQRSNLEIRTHQQNLWDRLPNGRSKYVGVYVTKYKTIRAAIRDNTGRKIALGTFKTEREAAISYNEAAIKFRGKFAGLNKI